MYKAMISDKANGHPPKQSATVTQSSRMFDDEPRASRWWVWLIILAIVGGVGYLVAQRILHPATKADPRAGGARAVPVETAAARTGNMNIYLRELGTVTPMNTATIRSRVDGQIVKVLYTEGQLVKKDQALVEIDPRPFQTQLVSAQGQLAKDQALLENAKRDLARYQDLAKQNYSVTQQQVDTQQSLVDQYNGAVKIDQGQIDSINLQLTYCHITAPFEGRIGLRLVDEGNMVHANDANGIAVIAQVHPVSVVFTIPEDDISRVLTKNSPDDKLVVLAYNRDDRTALASGTLLAIDNQADPTTAMIKLKASYTNENNALFPNQFVRAWLLVDTLKDVLLVPNAAVQRGPANAIFVYVVKPADQTVELRNIKIGPSENNQTVIESGLTAGELVVTTGIDKLQNGSKVVMSTEGDGRAGRGGRGGAAGTGRQGGAPVQQKGTSP